MTFNSNVARQASQAADWVARNLAERKTDKVVFAESCTAGLVAALLGQIPGISNWLCGSAVTYRESVKQAWLAVSADTLTIHTAESLETTSEMAVGVLKQSAEATVAAAVTGHLGPGAPADIDGRIFVAVARRFGEEIRIVKSDSLQLNRNDRVERQFEAAKCVLEILLAELT